MWVTAGPMPVPLLPGQGLRVLVSAFSLRDSGPQSSEVVVVWPPSDSWKSLLFRGIDILLMVCLQRNLTYGIEKKTCASRNVCLKITSISSLRCVRPCLQHVALVARAVTSQPGPMASPQHALSFRDFAPPWAFWVRRLDSGFTVAFPCHVLHTPQLCPGRLHGRSSDKYALSAADAGPGRPGTDSPHCGFCLGATSRCCRPRPGL